jgi:flagellum-specific peptidoglycan hydrolase FlgJ
MVIKKVFFFAVLFLLVGCHSSKPVVRTTKSNTPARTVKKPVSSTKTSKETVKKVEEPEVLVATSAVKVTPEIVTKYIEDFKGIAKNNMTQYGIPASITLAQGILESGSGTGVLSVKANNHFGIKCHKEWEGPSVRHDDDSEQECFRKYEHASESYRDHSMFLTTRSRYASLFELPKDDYEAWATGLRAAGYATDPKYPEKLISLIERYQLYQYDEEVLKSGTTSQTSSSKSKERFSEKTYTVVQGDTLYSISKKTNIPLDELKRKNNLKDNSIAIGQVLKL